MVTLALVFVVLAFFIDPIGASEIDPRCGMNIKKMQGGDFCFVKCTEC